mmetsp:Transcript_51722/g.165577  ORF Transcript_51722/g.165577 Transcript_51722/m.165577 type:complete len:184 (-) Transcript_51722:69-620(-)
MLGEVPAGPSECIFSPDAAAMPVTAEGWVVVQGLNTILDYRVFTERVVSDVLGANISDYAAFETWTHYAWGVKTWEDLLRTLRAAPWTCGEAVGRNPSCLPVDPAVSRGPSLRLGKYAWLRFPFACLALGVLAVSVLTCLNVLLSVDSTREWFDKQREVRFGKSPTNAGTSSTTTASEDDESE